MAENKKYYFMKLKDDFFNSDELRILESMPDGYLYSNILLKLYLKSLEHEGKLMYRNTMPYTPEFLAPLLGHQVETVKKALDIFKQLGLIEILENGAIYMVDIQNFIGNSSSEGDRKRAYRQSISNEKKSDLQNLDKAAEERVADEQPVEEKKIEKSKMAPAKSDDVMEKPVKPSPKQPKKEEEEKADVAALILNDGSEWQPGKTLYEEYVKLFPNVDVPQQFNAMRSWCISNPQQRKTNRGITRFVNSWLSREQNSRFRTQSFPKSYQEPKSTNTSSFAEALERIRNESRSDLEQNIVKFG